MSVEIVGKFFKVPPKDGDFGRMLHMWRHAPTNRDDDSATIDSWVTVDSLNGYCKLTITVHQRLFASPLRGSP